ncbi:MAG: hypothetical protein AAB653_00350 [Patescibacteria group bacterium]
MKELKKIDKFSLAKIVGLFYGLAGFLSAFFIAIFTIINAIVKQKDFKGSEALVILVNFGADLLLVVLLFLITFSVGWLVGYLFSVVYNIFSTRFGGVKVDLVETEEKNTLN